MPAETTRPCQKALAKALAHLCPASKRRSPNQTSGLFEPNAQERACSARGRRRRLRLALRVVCSEADKLSEPFLRLSDRPYAPPVCVVSYAANRSIQAETGWAACAFAPFALSARRRRRGERGAPGDGGDDHPVLLAADTRRLRLQVAARGAEIERSPTPPAPLGLLRPAARSSIRRAWRALLPAPRRKARRALPAPARPPARTPRPHRHPQAATGGSVGRDFQHSSIRMEPS